jgi:hypothetical protein
MKTTKVYTVIQLYAGDDDNENQIWIDTVWKTVKEAKKDFPEETYRKVSTLSTPIETTFLATAHTCSLKSAEEE